MMLRDLLSNRRGVIVVAGAVLLVTATLATLVSQVGRDGHRHPVTAQEPTSLGPLTAQPGRRSVDGVLVGYPHTLAGAVSAAAEYLADVASTLDPDRAAAITRIAADPAASELPDDLASSAARARAHLDLPTSGSLPDATAFLTTPQMYQLREAHQSADRVLVLLLTSNTFLNGSGGMASSTGVFPVSMHWSHGDWKLADIGGTTDYSSLDATPGSEAARALGWQPLMMSTAPKANGS